MNYRPIGKIRVGMDEDPEDHLYWIIDTLNELVDRVNELSEKLCDTNSPDS